MFRPGPSLAPRHLDDDWLFADPMAMDAEAADDPEPLCRPARAARKLRGPLRAATIAAVLAVGALIAMALTAVADRLRGPLLIGIPDVATCAERGKLPVEEPRPVGAGS